MFIGFKKILLVPMVIQQDQSFWLSFYLGIPYEGAWLIEAVIYLQGCEMPDTVCPSRPFFMRRLLIPIIAALANQLFALIAKREK